MYIAIAESLFAIKDTFDGKWDNAAGNAYAFASICTTFDFIMALVMSDIALRTRDPQLVNSRVHKLI